VKAVIVLEIDLGEEPSFGALAEVIKELDPERIADHGLRRVHMAVQEPAYAVLHAVSPDLYP
jgi:hypothetical protein